MRRSRKAKIEGATPFRGFYMELKSKVDFKKKSREAALLAADFVKRHYKKLLIAAAVFFALFIFVLPSINFIKFMLIIPIFIILGSFSTFYHNYFHAPIDFELVKLFTVLAAVAYGIFPGIFVGVASTLFGRILSGRIDHRMIFSISAIAVISILAAAFSNSDIFVLGLALTIVYHIITAPFSLLMGDNPGFGALYIGSNIVFNIFFFAKIAPLLLPVL